MHANKRVKKMSKDEVLSPRDRELFVYKRVDEDYELSNFLGKGKFSNVYLATHRQTGQKVAVKCLKQPLSADTPLFTQQVLHEIRVLKHLKNSTDSTGMLQLVNCYYNEGRVFILTQYCDGGNIFDKIYELNRQQDKYSEKECARMFHHLFTTLSRMHKQGKVIHNDLKHENFLWTSNSEDAGIIIGDFGMAKYLPQENIFKEMRGPREGTWGYMAPEILERHVQSVKTDCWAMGVGLYIMLQAALPFNPTNVRKYGVREIYRAKRILRKNLTVGEDAADLIDKLLKIEPSERFDADQALQHPFLRKWREQNPAELSSLEPALRRFQARQKFRGACRAIEGGAFLNRLGILKSMIPEKDFPPMHFEKLRGIFNRHCQYRSNNVTTNQRSRFSVSRESFIEVMKELDLGHLPIDRLFTVFDSDGDGTVDFQEFICGLALLHGPSERTLKCKRFCFIIIACINYSYLFRN
eukprot:gb/GECG01011947.1/.p1 GENE.gb/GECG01011947.1/~~gb/GECG01011947.1/.p1  ORF type:complete len:468 (+),score=45.07 gb/GECG01011947.1/:1-1404(+)